MKIIGQVNSSNFLVEASDQELVRCMGYGSTYGDSVPKLSVGKVININALWDALQVERSRPSDLQTLADKLREAASQVDKINTALASPIIVTP